MKPKLIWSVLLVNLISDVLKEKILTHNLLKGQLQAEGGSILMWGAFCHDGIGPIVQIQNAFNSEKCIELLEETVKPFVKENMAKRFVYQLDNSPAHKSK